LAAQHGHSLLIASLTGDEQIAPEYRLVVPADPEYLGAAGGDGSDLLQSERCHPACDRRRHGEHRFGDINVLAGGLTREQEGFEHEVFTKLRRDAAGQETVRNFVL
jgi:hypothetical protein